MGWCSGTEIFDTVVKSLENGDDKRETIKSLLQVLEEHDWDCQCDSNYFKNPTVESIFKELHPDWYEDN
jgi:NADH:ubiquinone oxidoreductase subunit F (NADH-binding)